MTDFVHLHNHTDYSLLDGASSISKMTDKALEFGMKHLAITDHGNMFGVLRFYKDCRKKGINPIIGCEFYVTPESRHNKSGTESGNRYHHLVLLAKNNRGYKNLIKLSSIAYVEGFYYKPRIDEEVLREYSSDLICSSACIAGEIPSLILAGNIQGAEAKALYYRELFGPDNFYLELQDHGIKEQKIANRELTLLSRKTGIPLIATNDIHYITKEDAVAQDILLCIGTGKKRNEEKRLKFESGDFYMKSPEEMYKLFGEVPESLKNTVKIGEMCNLNIELPGPQLPDYEIPPQFRSLEHYLKELTEAGLRKRYQLITEEIQQRSDFELNVINSMGYAGYFLIVWDFIDYARKNGIPVGPGRGSGAGSIVAYALGITDIDPIKYHLLFERFLNPERVSMPDFDIDFCFERRQEVINYVNRKYGEEKVGQIITFGTLKAKAVIRDVARVLDIPYGEADYISKLVPSDLKINVVKALEQEPKLRELYQKGGIYAELIDTSKRLEGLSRHASTHAAGVVIGKLPLTEYVPLYREAKTGAISTQYTMDQLEECGLVKMDFLGLKTLTLIRNTEELIRKRGIPFDIETIPEDDAETYKLLGDGKSACIFQFESSGMQGVLKQAKPNSIEDLIALNALYRPGPMQYIPQFVASKNGTKPITYPDPSLEEILKPTYGVIVYQEQVMQVAQIIGGFSLGKADLLRRAMSKKKEKEMEKMKAEFLSGARAKGLKEKLAADIFEMLKPFANYGFNKSHAAAYSVLAYKTAFLKANYPAEFMAANLTNEINNPDKLALYIAETRNMGIDILPPDINISDKLFTVSGGNIVYGLVGVKNVGAAAVEEIIRKREESGPYVSMPDFLEKIDLRVINRKVIESLIFCGAFDSLGVGRATLLHNLERLLEIVSRQKESQLYGQATLFEGDDSASAPEFEMEQVEEWPSAEKLRIEKELLGFFVSGHPMDRYRPMWEKAVDFDLSRPDRAMAEKIYTILGTVTSIRVIQTKKGKPMAFVKLEDFAGSIEMIFFPEQWEKYRDMVVSDHVLGFSGKVDKSRDEVKFIVDRMIQPEELKEKEVREIHARIDRSLCTEEELYSLRSSLFDLKGPCSFFIHLRHSDNGADTVIKASSQISLGASKEILESIRNWPCIEEVWTA